MDPAAAGMAVATVPLVRHHLLRLVALQHRLLGLCGGAGAARRRRGLLRRVALQPRLLDEGRRRPLQQPVLAAARACVTVVTGALLQAARVRGGVRGRRARQGPGLRRAIGARARPVAAVRRHQLPARPDREARLVGHAGRLCVRLVALGHAAAHGLPENHEEAEGGPGDDRRQRELGHSFQSLRGVRQHVHEGGSQEDSRCQRVTADQELHGQRASGPPRCLQTPSQPAAHSGEDEGGERAQDLERVHRPGLHREMCLKPAAAGASGQRT
mmetsp:Transcript_9773/g.25316  ORF Transcript_9773/g.25316 Transcript_9773/m.25316 type:complete len:271 (+) Transcript_9773:32-844(+)